jgi:putative transposase
MKKQRFSETQIVSVLKQYEGGREAMDVCREYGISKATLSIGVKNTVAWNPSMLKSLRLYRRRTGGLNRCMQS